jgi:periplasmic copper chaperone A
MPDAQRRTIRRLMLAAGCAALAWTAFAFSAQVLSTIEADDAWIRWLPGSLPVAGYVILRNAGDKPVVLVGAESAVYGNTLLHETRNKDGVSEMINVDNITVPAHGAIAFSPGGYHMMLMQAKKQIKPGDRVPVTLTFEGGGILSMSFEVRNADGSSVGGVKGMDTNIRHDVQH